VGAGGAAGSGGLPAPEDSGPRPYRALRIATGQYHSCALLEDHQVKCWGYNYYGQLGLGDTQTRGLAAEEMGDNLPFLDLGSGRSAKSVAAGRYATCVILDDDSLKCWGYTGLVAAEGLGMVGDEPAETGDGIAPVPLGAGHTAKAVAPGYAYSCILLEDDSFWCAIPGNPPALVAAATDASLLEVATFASPLALYDDGSVRVVRGDMPSGPEPFEPEIVNGVRLMAAGEHRAAFLKNDGSLIDDYALLDSLPSVLPAGVTQLALAQLGRHLCALLSDGAVQCWGDGIPGTPTAEATLLPLAGPALQVSGNAQHHFCALLADGGVQCWVFEPETAPQAGLSDPGTGQLLRVDLGIYTPP
jgi:hypothetical protein